MADINHEEIQRLVGRARGGDREAFSEIVALLMNPIVALTYRMTGNRETALDLAQETFVSAWENLKSFRGEARFESWLYRIASNKALNYLHSHQAESLDTVDEVTASAESPESPDRNLLREELREAILEFMSELPPQQRLAFELRFYRQFSFDEISEVTGKALGTVKTNYRESVIKLREYASKRGWRP